MRWTKVARYSAVAPNHASKHILWAVLILFLNKHDSKKRESSDEGLTLETSAVKLFTVANLHYQTNIESILAVMNTVELVAEIRPEKNSGPYGIWTYDLCDTGAALYKVS